VRRSDRAEIRFHCLCAPKRPILALLQHAQEPRLQISRHVGYFVKEQGAAVCRSDHSWEIVHRSGEGAFDVTEKFSLDHRVWERSAIELHHRLSSTPAAGVNSVCDHFLAHAAFASY